MGEVQIEENVMKQLRRALEDWNIGSYNAVINSDLIH